MGGSPRCLGSRLASTRAARYEVSSLASVPRPEDLRFVYAGAGPNYEYPIGALSVGEEPARRSVAIIFISSVEDRVIVALPQKAWDRKVAKRKIPTGPFVKPLLVEVAAAAPEDREQQGDFYMRVWLGSLSRAVADTVVFDAGLDSCDVPFAGAGGLLGTPYAPALLQLADSQFSFVTAPSGDANEIRLKKLEASMSEISATLKTLVSSRAPPAPKASTTLPGRAARPKAKPAEGSVPGTPVPRGGTASELPVFDPALARLARESGLPAQELSEVVALTKIVADLAGKKKSEKASSLEAALDKAEGFGPSSDEGFSSSSAGRSKAAAHRLLKETLVRDPALIYGAVERLLEEDLLQRRLGTCLQDAKASARAWLEFRSNLGPYPTTIRLAWQIAGIWDSLREGKVEEARARAALAVAACDQQSLDSGSWILAEQFCLEPAPPLSAFSNRRQHQLDPADSYHSRLFEPRWAELCLHKVRELELHLEAKKKLGGKGRQTPLRSDSPAPSGTEKGDKGRKGGKAGPQGGP